MRFTAFTGPQNPCVNHGKNAKVAKSTRVCPPTGAPSVPVKEVFHTGTTSGKSKHLQEHLPAAVLTSMGSCLMLKSAASGNHATRIVNRPPTAPESDREWHNRLPSLGPKNSSLPIGMRARVRGIFHLSAGGSL